MKKRFDHLEFIISEFRYIPAEIIAQAAITLKLILRLRVEIVFTRKATVSPRPRSGCCSSEAARSLADNYGCRSHRPVRKPSNQEQGVHPLCPTPRG